MFEKLALSAALAALATAPAAAFNPQPDPPGHAVRMADGSLATLLPNGKLSEATADGKRIVLGPGTYKLKSGKTITIDATGVVTAASRAMLNPQPLPP